MRKTITYLILGLLFVGAMYFVGSNTSIRNTRIDDNCYEIKEYWVLERANVTFVPNVSDSKNLTTVIKWYNSTEYIISRVCRPILEMDGIVVDYAIQGYNCKNQSGGVICDSCSDGNCDGICDKNGGETCCKLMDKSFVCKNGRHEWEEHKMAIPKLKVKSVTKPTFSGVKI